MAFDNNKILARGTYFIDIYVLDLVLVKRALDLDLFFKFKRSHFPEFEHFKRLKTNTGSSLIRKVKLSTYTL